MIAKSYLKKKKSVDAQFGTEKPAKMLKHACIPFSVCVFVFAINMTQSEHERLVPMATQNGGLGKSP